MEVVIKKEYVYLGIGFLSVAVIGTVAILIARSRSKIDLNKFDSPDIPGSGKCMDKTFLKMLQQLQKKSGYPIFDWINSGARSVYWNSRVGGVQNSAHKIPACKAVDIGTKNKTIRDNLVKAAREIGFKRIGIGSKMIHLDNDNTKKQYVAWGYPAGSPPPYNPFA
ncbi:D-Ala-D-Ala carboxypeptidase family metallohydrolase [Fulvivirgaceae bacterium BMA10]|uniref:D-Ala-D-Ala carboxypeptidase family metallohydrolase n=1 Tax=Splendidivirga corallicola TaxID=3051826 RepID=A0ABT8KKL1_9BACT|nr:D-Ala-D-Ala carboxypeptidase family metallohydrolase [Fulvivirgaceae bacterium BMA10]